MTLSIIADTIIYPESKNLYLFNSVARELNTLHSLGVEINSICGVKTESKLTVLELLNQEVVIVNFLKLNRSISKTNLVDFYLIFKTIKHSEFLHVRGPSIAMFYSLILSPFFPKKKFWFKYANVWNESGRSYFWDIQKWLLKKNSKINVTINGSWPKLPPHIIPFENPCFYEIDIENSKIIQKDWSGLKTLIFVGRITEEKGVFRILDGLTGDFKEMLFVGVGKDYERLAREIENHPLKNKIRLIGEASKESVLKLFEEAHFLLLPTTSPEGFPKVIAEAWLKKCIPVTSDISSIPQYVIEGKTGVLWKRNTENWYETLQRALTLDSFQCENIENEIVKILPKFTYEYFGNRIINEVFEIN